MNSLEDLFQLDRVAAMFHPEIQDDKRSTLFAVARLMAEAGAKWVVTGGLAAQLYVDQPRFTLDVDAIVRPEDEASVFSCLQTPAHAEEFELIHRKRRWIALVHRRSGTPVDINSSKLFQDLVEDPSWIDLEGVKLPFAASRWIAFVKLRTQRRSWPRNPEKRLQDRADLMKILMANPEVPDELRSMVDEEMARLLEQVIEELRQRPTEDLPPEE